MSKFLKTFALFFAIGVVSYLMLGLAIYAATGVWIW